MVAVPGPTPVTRPEEEFTVATAVLPLDQVPGVPVVLKAVVDPTHTAWFPLSVPASDVTDTVAVVTVLFASVELHPLPTST